MCIDNKVRYTQREFNEHVKNTLIYESSLAQTWEKKRGPKVLYAERKPNYMHKQRPQKLYLSYEIRLKKKSPWKVKNTGEPTSTHTEGWKRA